MERKTHSCTFCDFTNHTDEYVGTLLSPEYDGIPVLLPFDELDWVFRSVSWCFWCVYGMELRYNQWE
jgi:hypothetical protein